MGLEGINFSKEQDDAKPPVENFRFSEATIQRVRSYLSGKALENTASVEALAENTPDKHNDGE